MHKIWEQILDDLRTENKVVSAFLEVANVLDLSNEKIEISFPAEYKFHYEHMEEYERREKLEDSVENILGKRVPLVIHLEKESKVDNSQRRAQSYHSLNQNSPGTKSEAVSLILDEFHAEVIG